MREKSSPALLARLRVQIDASIKWRLPLDSLTQAIIILLQNAEQADRSGAAIELHIRPQEGACEIEVIDAGPEPDAAILQRASDPFFTTKSPGEGMGLGLFLVQCLAQRMGGSFAISRSPQGRTHARLRLCPPTSCEIV